MTDSTSSVADRHKSAEFVIKTVDVVGLEHMGYAFATNLIEDGYQVLVDDRDPERMMALQAAGALGAPRPSDLAGCDVVLTSLPNGDALAKIALPPNSLANVLHVNAVHISHGEDNHGQKFCSISPQLSRRNDRRQRGRSNGNGARGIVWKPR